MENIAKEILKHLGNEHTKVERKQGFMGNYYSPLIDTIYIAEDFENTKVPDDAKNINKKAAELIVICHECIHSVQSKTLHILNTIFANVSMILFLVYIVMALFWTSSLWIKIATITALVTSIVIRLILEVGATNGSTKLAKEVVNKGLLKDITDEDIQQGIEYIDKNKWIAFPQMILDKIIFLILVLIIK